MEELGKGLKALKGIWTPQKDQESQLTWTPGSSETKPATKEHIRAEKGPRLYVANMQLSLHVVPLKFGWEALSKAVTWRWYLTPLFFINNKC